MCCAVYVPPAFCSRHDLLAGLVNFYILDLCKSRDKPFSAWFILKLLTLVLIHPIIRISSFSFLLMILVLFDSSFLFTPFKFLRLLHPFSIQSSETTIDGNQFSTNQSPSSKMVMVSESFIHHFLRRVTWLATDGFQTEM